MYSYVQNNSMNFSDPTGHLMEGDCSLIDDDCDPVHPLTGNPVPVGNRGGGNDGGGEEDNNILIISGELEDSGPTITDFILQLPGSTADWSNLATGLDILAWLSDLYAASAVTYAGFAGAALPAPLIAVGLPEVPLVTGLAGMAIAELYIQPVLFTGNTLATFSMGATIISDTKAGNTRIEESEFSTNVLNSMALTDVGWMSNEAYLSLAIQSISVANDLQWTSLPFPSIP